MSTLIALKLERELEITRCAMAKRPALVMQWHLDPQSGRPVTIWTVAHRPIAPKHALA